MDILSIREDFISGKVDLISFYTDVIKRIEDKKDLNIFLDFSKEKIMERVEFLNNKLKNKYYIIIKSPQASVEAAMKSVTEKAMDLKSWIFK